jgi:hypothetical protein
MGNIKPIRKGIAKNSPQYYSRTEILALKRAEIAMQKKAAEILFKEYSNESESVGNGEEVAS